MVHSEEAEALSRFTGRLPRWKTGQKSEKSERHPLLTSSLQPRPPQPGVESQPCTLVTDQSHEGVKEVGATIWKITEEEERRSSCGQREFTLGVYFWMCGATCVCLQELVMQVFRHHL